MVTLSLDIGGTRMKLALLQEGKILVESNVPAFRFGKYQDNLDNAHTETLLMMQEIGIDHIDGMGIAFPGIVNPVTKVVVSANDKFVDAVGYDLAAWVKRTFDCPFILDNDSNAALIGEVAYGCATDTRDCTMMIFGTGVGAAAMIGGRMIRGKHFQAACIGGHIAVQAGPDAYPCNCGNRGCMEANASTWALPILARKDPLFEVSGLASEQVVDYRALTKWADAQDALACKLLERSFDCWAAAIVSHIHCYDPEVVVLSGGITQMGEPMRSAIEQRVHQFAWTPWGKVQVRMADDPQASVVLGLHAMALDEIAGKCSF